jgi:hypothetical protein
MNTRQRGMASLLTALVLMLSMTLVTLSTARTHTTETRMAGNEHRHYRLHLAAGSAWESASQQLTDEGRQPVWTPDPETGALVSRPTLPAADEAVDIHVLFSKAGRDSRVVDIQASATLPGSGRQAVKVSQAVRLLGVLSPLAESAPPLVLNGCLLSAAVVEIRPMNGDSANAGDALWQFGAGGCPPNAKLDTHAGHVIYRTPTEDLWQSLFSVSREEYARLAADERTLPAAQRRYWLAGADIGRTRLWRLSVGSAQRPVVVVFPAAAGCPRFASGVRIVGVVYIDAACRQPPANASLTVTGTLAVNGALDTGHALVRLNHIQVADPGQTRLAFPVLRIVKLPGSWRDF